MTAIQMFGLASVGAAILFFAAGAATTAIRMRRPVAPSPVPFIPPVPPAPPVNDGLVQELVALRAMDQSRAEELARVQRALVSAEGVVRVLQTELDEQATLVKRDEPEVAEREAVNRRAASEREAALKRAASEREAVAQRAAAEREAVAQRAAAAREATLAASGEAASREVRVLRTKVESIEAANATLRATEQMLRGEIERVQRELVTAEATVKQLRLAADDRTKHLATELDRSRGDAVVVGRDLDQLQTRLREVETLLAERTQAARDLSTQNEQLKGRLTDAEGLRAEYVRLRTTVTESTYLKSEIARLETELQAMKIDALGAPRRRTARGSDLTGATPLKRAPTSPERSIGDSLARVIEKFSDAGTRSVAIADGMGFPLASSGDDGVALAAYAALLIESANRGKELLPITAPAAIEIIDENGARVSVWTFNVESDRLLLVNLAVTPVDTTRVESTLADLTAILVPTPERSYSR